MRRWVKGAYTEGPMAGRTIEVKPKVGARPNAEGKYTWDQISKVRFVDGTVWKVTA